MLYVAYSIGKPTNQKQNFTKLCQSPQSAEKIALDRLFSLHVQPESCYIDLH